VQYALSDASAAGVAVAVRLSWRLAVATAAPCLLPHHTQQQVRQALLELPAPAAWPWQQQQQHLRAAVVAAAAMVVILLAMALKAMAYCLLLARAAPRQPLQRRAMLGTGSSSSSTGWGHMTSCQKLVRSTALGVGCSCIPSALHLQVGSAVCVCDHSACLCCCATAGSPAAVASLEGGVLSRLGAAREWCWCSSLSTDSAVGGCHVAVPAACSALYSQLCLFQSRPN
jgi:hypothetical protein